MKKFSALNYLGIILLLFILFGSFGFSSALKVNDVYEKTILILKPENQLFTPELVKKEIIKLHIQHPDIVYKQCLIESNGFKSNIFKQNNNCLGMKQAMQRPTTATGTNFGHATYNNWRDCIIDYSIWQGFYAKNLTNNEYIQLLGEIYAEDVNYKQLIK